ncbi:MAG: hypothetical protein LH629_00495 [Ignavibacteria bacterium]|nr:hypothetical protein [Ignavibacteria bacterium]
MKLYKKSTLGQALEWAIFIEDDGYYTVSGQINGKLITSAIKKCVGKNFGKINSTSNEEQAIQEAKALYDKKLRSGYVDNLDKIDNEKKFFSPMLAKDYADLKKPLEFPVFSQCKLDGCRMIAKSDGLFTRTGKVIYGVPHIFDSLKPLFKEFSDLILDGELYNHEENFEDIISIVRKEKPTEKELTVSKDLIKFYVYDMVNRPTISLPFQIRSMFIRDVLSKYEFVEIVKTDVAENQAELDQFYAQYMTEGYEGQMIRLDEPYENKRSKNLLKRKEFITAEFTVLDIVNGNGKFANIANKAIIEVNGLRCDPPINGSFGFLKEILDNKKDYIGKSATVKFFEYTADGSLRFPKIICFAREEFE